ncbi:MAG TPA: site-2 protease family protein [Candidatus Nanoarchaeia archaeon]|nr:site-2 protease family protein [Candidatus Nanoarchaeia archaeon]
MQREFIQVGPYTTSRVELKEIAKACIAVAIAFTIYLTSLNIRFLPALAISFSGIVLGMVLHEIAHKLVAQRYGCVAEFRSFPTMLLLGIVLSVFGVVFLAPGAVFISGPVGRRRNGKISAAGPFTNMILAGIFLLLTNVSNPLVVEIAKYGAMINAWLALFNMIPFGPLDGKKVFQWNKLAYGVLLIISIILLGVV